MDQTNIFREVKKHLWLVISRVVKGLAFQKAALSLGRWGGLLIRIGSYILQLELYPELNSRLYDGQVPVYIEINNCQLNGTQIGTII